MQVACAVSTWTLGRQILVPALAPTTACGLASLQLGEVLQHAQAGRLALLRMELHGEKIVAPDPRAERGGIVGFGGDDRCVLRHDVIRVDEIEVRAVGDALEDRRAAVESQLVPAHVRHLVLARHVEPHDLARQDAEPFVLAVFVALVEQHLQAEADAQERLAAGDRGADRLDQLALAKCGDRVAKRAHARQHDLVRVRQHGRVARDRGRVPDSLEPLLHAAKVAHFVVDDGDHGGDGRRGWLSGSDAGRAGGWGLRAGSRQCASRETFARTII